MSWFKKKFTKLFKDDEQDTYDEHYEEQYEQPYVEEPAPEPPPQAKKAFRFPVIDDDDFERGPKTEKVSRVQQSSVSEHDRPLELPKHLQQTEHVYEVETQGIRDLLARRQKRVGRSHVLPNPLNERRKATVTKEEQQYFEATPVREEKKKVNREFVNPLENKRRFVPTEVPSPVHGFKKPTPINDLLTEKKKEREEEPAPQEEPDTIKVIQHEKTIEIPRIIEEEPIVMTEPKRAEFMIEGVEEGPPVIVDPADYEPNDELILLDEESAQQELAVTEEPLAVIHEPEPLAVEEQSSTSFIVEEEPVVEKPTAAFAIEEEPVIEQPSQAFEVEEETVTEEPVAAFVIEEEPALEKSISAFDIEEEPLAQVTPSQQPMKDTKIVIDGEEAIEALADMQIQHLKIENSTIHIGQLNVEQAQQNEFIQHKKEPEVRQEPELEPEQVEEPIQPKSTGSRIPFNVLMLSSDKQKLKAKEMLQQHIQKPTVAPISTPSKEEPQATIVMPKLTVQQEAPIAVLEREAPAEAEAVDIKQLATSLILEEEEEQQVLELVTDLDTSTEATEQQVDEPTAMIEVEAPKPKIEAIPTVQQAVVTPIEASQQPQQAVEMIEPEPVTEPVAEPKYVHQYEKPSMALLVQPEEQTEDFVWMDEQGERLIEALSHFHIDAEIVSIVQGPAVTQFEITVAHGTKVSKVRGLADDIKLALAARDIRIDAPIPGKHSIGIEIPNRTSRAVRLSEVTNSEAFTESDSPLEAALGLDLSGSPVTLDLRKMPHGLIAGATGSGKSVCINSILVSLLYKADPHELKLMLIDPKMVELAPFNHIPHLVSPVITDVKAATAALKWAVDEMERRYQLFMHAGVRDLTRFNDQAEKAGQHGHKLPYILIVIDELADLMMMSPADVEEAICRIAQKARACGIHLIIATQRPSVDVITGLIKSNIPTRIAFAVSSAIDSRTILDMQGAERLLGRGDMLYFGNGMPAPVRLQGTFVTDDEIEEIIQHVRKQGEPEYFFQHDELLKKAEFVDEQDELFEEVCRYVFEAGTASTSSIQRRYKIGYNRAARLIDMLERHGYVSEQRGSKPRDVFITESDIISMFE